MVDEFARATDGGMLVVDIRSPEAYAGAHVPKSFSLPLDMLPAFAGMFLAYDQPIGLIVEDYSQIEEAVRGLTRIGYDQVDGFLAGGLPAWEKYGRRYDRIVAIHITDREQRIDEGGDRATIAAAFLRRCGMQPVEVCLGSMSACSHVACQVIIEV